MSFTLRTDPDKDAALAKLIEATGERTASKAIWRAVAEYPAMRDKLASEARRASDAQWEAQAAENELHSIREHLQAVLVFAGHAGKNREGEQPAWIEAL